MDKDAQNEIDIFKSYLVVTDPNTPVKDRMKEFDLMRERVANRSPKQVAEMEKKAGLR